VNVLDTRTLAQLQELIGGDRAELIELVETFLVEGDEIVADMQAASTSGDVELLRRSAHSLKASAQDFGANQLSTLCATLESGSKTAIPDAVDAQVREITNQFATAKHEIKLYIEDKTGGLQPFKAGDVEP